MTGGKLASVKTNKIPRLPTFAGLKALRSPGTRYLYLLDGGSAYLDSQDSKVLMVKPIKMFASAAYILIAASIHIVNGSPISKPSAKFDWPSTKAL
jgi:hypothetical protein